MSNAVFTCRLCLSPYKNEILAMKKQGISVPAIHKKYAGLMEYTASPKALYLMIRTHIRNHHDANAIMVPSGSDSAIQIKRATIQNYSQRMLELALQKAEGATSDTVTFKDANAAIKLSLDAQKIKIAESAMMLEMAKLFGPPIEGEVLDGTGSPESKGI